MTEKLASSEIAESRERFEERADKAGLALDWDDGYEDIETDAAWRGYQWAERDTRERLDKEWSRMFFNPYMNNRKEGRCCKCLTHCPSINEMAHHATCPVVERIRGKE